MDLHLGGFTDFSSRQQKVNKNMMFELRLDRHHQRLPSLQNGHLCIHKCLRKGRIVPRSPDRLRVQSTRGFHQDRLAIQKDQAREGRRHFDFSIRETEEDEELLAASHLRAISFYAYPPERALAGKIHQRQVRDEEFKALKRQRKKRRQGLDKSEKSATIVATCPISKARDIEEALRLGRRQSQEERQQALLGCLDVHAVRAMPGEVLIGDSKHAAYMANVCVSVSARRQGVGAALIERVRDLCREWGVDGLYVHTQAVNEVARSFYERQGFIIEQEESSNDAHYRGKCLDGIEGRGRSILLRDTVL